MKKIWKLYNRLGYFKRMFVAIGIFMLPIWIFLFLYENNKPKIFLLIVLLEIPILLSKMNFDNNYFNKSIFNEIQDCWKSSTKRRN